MSGRGGDIATVPGGRGYGHGDRARVVAIIDDDESVRQATESLLKSLGHPSMTFESAEKFLGSPSIGRTTCLITDVKMPGITGTELLGILRSQGLLLPIIFVTGYPDSRLREQALAAGAICFLTKPFDAAALLTCLEAALNKGDVSPS